MSKYSRRQLLLVTWIAGIVLGHGTQATADQVIADDLIVQGSICTGLDCVNNEVFDFDTFRLKENNLRINFNDTSVGSFPTRNWQIRANSSSSGGGDFLGIVDQGPDGVSESGTIVFSIDSGAPANALRVSSAGRLGIRTATPVLDLHIRSGNTPALRLEQDGSSGFTSHSWDIIGNEVSFAVRDVTSGSQLPFRIFPGAPSSSVKITADGVSFLSSRDAKEGFEPIDPDAILERLAELPLTEWSYKGGSGARHMGPVAEDFHAAFPLGGDDRSINPLDVAGVALAGIQSLHSEVERLADQTSATHDLLAEREQEIALLKEDRRLLEERLETLETVVRELLGRESDGRGAFRTARYLE